MSSLSQIPCRHLSTCNGCHFAFEPYASQLLQKKEILAKLFTDAHLSIPEIQIKTCGENFLRQRFDFTIEDGAMGLYDKNQKLLDLHECSQLAPAVAAAFLEFKKIVFPIKKGSVRLRVGPTGIKGVWLDFANLDIKNLLTEQTCFKALLELGFKIEVGQKAKTLSKLIFQTEDRFKLTDPEPQAWFKTDTHLLECFISSFTQPSWDTAHVITETILKWLHPNQVSCGQHIAEFGSGIGQFTLPLLAQKHNVDVYESHEQAVQLLLKNAQRNGLEENLQIYRGDYQKMALPVGKRYDAVVVNPPRSGLKDFTQQIISVAAETIIYISCFPESLKADSQQLLAAGYKLREIILVDQFPQTKHFETCVLLQRINSKT